MNLSCTRKEENNCLKTNHAFIEKRNERMQQKKLKSIQKTPQTKDAKKLSPTKRNPTHNSKNLWVIDKSP